MLASIKRGEVGAGQAVDKFIDDKLGKYAHQSVHSFCYGIKKWLQINGVKVNWDRIEFPTATEQREFDDAPTKQHLMTLMTHSATREKAVIEVLTSSGLRIGTSCSYERKTKMGYFEDIAPLKFVKMKRRKRITTLENARIKKVTVSSQRVSVLIPSKS